MEYSAISDGLQFGHTVDMALYHCTHLILQPADVIQPGNWGKKLMEIGPSHGAWQREIILEAVRIDRFQQKPSRLRSTFCCESLKTIIFYKSQQCPSGHVYEVELIEPNAAKHKGDFNAVQPMPRRPENMWEIAVKYWEYKLKTNVAGFQDVECSEIVSNSPLRILNPVNVCFNE